MRRAKPAVHSRASGDEETRTPDPRLAKAVLSQLSYIPFKIGKVGLVGLEPTTSPLSEERSNRLSYRPSLRKKRAASLDAANNLAWPNRSNDC